MKSGLLVAKELREWTDKWWQDKRNKGRIKKQGQETCKYEAILTGRLKEMLRY